jgi:uncharacterized membrane-anchored protein
MSQDRLDHILHAAIDAGILPAGAVRPATENRPWPLVLMIGLGAWLSAVPMFFVVALLFGDAILKGGGAFVIGTILLCAAVFVFRRASQSVFVEQLGLPVLLAGGGLIAGGLLNGDADASTVCGVLAVISCGVAVLVPRHWLRALLGALANALMLCAFAFGRHSDQATFWYAIHTALALWLLAFWLRDAVFVDGAAAPRAALLESFGAGWVLATLAALSAWSGATFMLGASAGMPHGSLGSGASWTPQGTAMAFTSAMLAAGACAWLALRWTGLRQWWAMPLALVLAGMAWLNPTVGGALLILALCAAGRRWRMASAAGLAAAWIVGAFYYQLNTPLATKAAIMVGAGLVLGAIARFAMRPGEHRAGVTVQTGQRHATIGILLSVVAIFAVINTGIWQKEKLIGDSRSVFVELAPVDPRSLMQGDYMRLNFRLPLTEGNAHMDGTPAATRQVVATVDERGIATLPRMHAGEPLAAGEFLIDLVRRDGRWTMVSDAWQFKEGEAERWAKARYGEFRVDANGRALLVGLRGAALEAL